MLFRSAEEAAAVEQLFSAIAFIEKLESDQMTIGATVAGCGPAFAAMFIEALGDGAVAYGLGREAAYRHRRGMDWHRPDRHHPDRTGHPRRRTHRRQRD